MSRLDSILVSDNWFEIWGDGSLWALERDFSDHCSLLLKFSNEGWGPKSFRFNNHWLNHWDFSDLVKSFLCAFPWMARWVLN